MYWLNNLPNVDKRRVPSIFSHDSRPEERVPTARHRADPRRPSEGAREVALKETLFLQGKCVRRMYHVKVQKLCPRPKTMKISVFKSTNMDVQCIVLFFTESSDRRDTAFYM